MSVITIERKLLEKNDEIARRNRGLLAQHGVFAINLLSSPGAGKTSLLELTIDQMKGRLAMGVIEGDVQTDLDAARIAAHDIPAVQIVTRGGCHLEAHLIEEALRSFDLAALDLLVIENVGNLVCPASFDLGEAVKVVIASVTEGEDKPLKYPAVFRNASAMIINKIDLLPHLRCDPALLRENALSVNPALTIFETSCVTREGIASWCDWIRSHLRSVR